MTVCGTGLGNSSIPGDPDLNLTTLTASPVRSGINVRWTYPAVNSHGLAHIALYRGVSNVFANAVQHKILGGDSYLDVISSDEPITYFYWIRLFSMSGAVGNIIGPASATANSQVQEILSLLEGRIADSVLATSLRTKIERIATLEGILAGETSSRVDSEGVFAELLSRLVVDLSAIDTLVGQEVIARTAADSALVASVNIILAKVEANAALILDERLVRVSANESIALSIQTVASRTGQNEAAIRSETQARTTQLNAVASQVNTLQSSVGGFTSQIQTVQQTYADLSGRLAAEHTLKVVAGKVASIGLRATNEESAIIMLAETFAIGSTTNATKYPFIISTVDGQQAIALNAYTMIADASIGNAKIANLAVDTLKIAGNSIMVPAFGSASITTTVGTALQSVLTFGFTISGVEAGYYAGVILNGACTAYPTTSAVSTLEFHLVVNGNQVSTAGASIDGFSTNAALAGMAYVTNGYNTVEIKVRTSTVGGGAASKACTIVAFANAFTGKR